MNDILNVSYVYKLVKKEKKIFLHILSTISIEKKYEYSFYSGSAYYEFWLSGLVKMLKNSFLCFFTSIVFILHLMESNMNVKLIESISNSSIMRYFVFSNSIIQKFLIIFVSLI